MVGVKKLVKVIEEHLRNHYLKSFGYTKTRIGDSKNVNQDTYGVEEQEEYDYYDEEEPSAGSQKI